MGAEDRAEVALQTFEAMTRQFIEAEIETGLTLAGVAAMEFDHGRPERGRAVTGQVARAVEQAQLRLQDAEGRGWDVTTLRDGLLAVCELLAQLKTRKPAA